MENASISIPMLEKTEKALNIWIEDQTQKKVPFSSIIIHEKANQLHQYSKTTKRNQNFKQQYLFRLS